MKCKCDGKGPKGKYKMQNGGSIKKESNTSPKVKLKNGGGTKKKKC